MSVIHPVRNPIHELAASLLRDAIEGVLQGFDITAPERGNEEPPLGIFGESAKILWLHELVLREILVEYFVLL